MRILVVDDHDLVRRGICSVLSTEPSLTICGEAVDGVDAIEKAAALKPDVVVMDISMPRLNGLEAAREIIQLLPNTKVIIVSQHEAAEMTRLAFRAGASAYVVKSSISGNLLAAIAKLKEPVSPPIERAPADSHPSFDVQEILQRTASIESALRGSEEHFRAAMNGMAEGSLTLDAEARVSYINPAAEKMLGWTSAELMGKDVHAAIHYKHPDGTPFPASECYNLQMMHDHQELREREDVFIRKNGSCFPVVLNHSPMLINGQPVGLVVVFRDDSKRRETETALQRSELLYRAISDSIDFGVWICDANGRNIYASPSFLQLTGLTQQECSDFGWSRMLHPDDVQGTIDAWQECVRTGTVWEREHRFRRADGGWQHVLARGVPVRDDQGKVLYWAGINLDIQRRKEAEIALEDRVIERTQELLRARNDLRELSGRLLKTQDEERRRIARELHDGVGQLLSGMKMNFASIIKERSKLSVYAARSVGETEALVDQALDDLRTMSYLLHPPLLDEIGLGSALQWYLDGFSARSKISASLDMAADFEKLPRDLELSLFRIVQECLTNIHRHSGSPTALVRLYHESGEIHLEVQDEGKGMTQYVLSGVSSGDSFGVGFRGIRERLRQFNGRLDIQSSDSGTIVSAVLPYDPGRLLQDEPDFVSEQSVRVAGSTQTESLSEDAATILCIDDEATGLYTRRLLLESAGHRVVEARSGLEGIRLFQSEKIDAVLLDYWMSGMKGTAVAAELKALNPSVPIIVLSGLPDFPGEATGVVDEWLLKGSNRAERLLDTIKAVLERRPV